MGVTCAYILRDNWSYACTDPVNRASLETIETAQFVVCLDRPHPNLHTGLANQHDSYSTFIANRCLHGSGSRYNSGNRWFDSSIQVRMRRGEHVVMTVIPI